MGWFAFVAINAIRHAAIGKIQSNVSNTAATTGCIGWLFKRIGAT
jgi:hypothetical protein